MSVFDPHLIHPTAPHHLSHGGLDRNDLARNDSSLIRHLVQEPGTRFVVVWRALNFFASGETGLSAMQCLGLDAIDAFLDQALVIYLGRDRSGMNMFVLIFLNMMKTGWPYYLNVVSLVICVRLFLQFLVMMAQSRPMQRPCAIGIPGFSSAAFAAVRLLQPGWPYTELRQYGPRRHSFPAHRFSSYCRHYL